MEFKCGRCKTFFILRGTCPGAERTGRPQEHFHAGNAAGDCVM